MKKREENVSEKGKNEEENVQEKRTWEGKLFFEPCYLLLV